MLTISIFACFAFEDTFVNSFLHKKPAGFSSNVEFDLQGANYVSGSFYSLQHNKATTKYTVVGETYLTLFEQYFDFTAGDLFVVQGGVCSKYSFPPVNLEHEIVTLFKEHTTYLGK